MSNDIGTGIGIGAGTVIGIAVLGALIYRFISRNWTGLTENSFFTTLLDIFTNIGRFAVTVLPFSVFMYGFVGDIINSNGVRLSIPSFAALAVVVANSIVGRIGALRNGVNLTPQDSSSGAWCAIPGLESLESPYLPNSIISTSVILFYYLCWSADLNYSPLQIILTLLAIALIQMVSFVQNCPSYYKPLFGNVYFNMIIAFGVGALVGISAFLGARFSPDGYGKYKPFSTSIGGSVSSGAASGNVVLPSGCPAGTTSIGGNLCQSSTGGAPVCEIGFTMRNGVCDQLLKNPGTGYSSADTPSDIYSATLIDSRGKPVIDALKIA